MKILARVGKALSGEKFLSFLCAVYIGLGISKLISGEANEAIWMFLFVVTFGLNIIQSNENKALKARNNELWRWKYERELESYISERDNKS